MFDLEEYAKYEQIEVDSEKFVGYFITGEEIIEKFSEQIGMKVATTEDPQLYELKYKV